jgi:hypothetical protein
LVNYWTKEIHLAKEFHYWFKELQFFRYDPQIQENRPELIPKYDYIIDTIIGVNLPECDLDQYTLSMNIDVTTYANNLARSFEKN